jgi:hypothetical protein
MNVSGIFEFSIGGVRTKFDISGSENEKSVLCRFYNLSTVIHNASVFSVWFCSVYRIEVCLY